LRDNLRRILTVDFVVCTLAVKKKKSGQVSTCRIGQLPCEFCAILNFTLYNRRSTGLRSSQR
jgi:hypothetical protein